MTEKLKIKEKIGYALGDAGGLLTFSLIGAFQNKFYTDVLGISPAKIVVLILVARIWDAINDPLWGMFIDSRKPTKYGRFRPYIFWFSIPLAVSAVFMFIVIPGLNEAKYLLFAYISYILYGMMYTAVNIPYGSLASVMTEDLDDRSTLSMFRSIGAGVGGLPGTIILPLIVYVGTGKVDPVTGKEITMLDGTRLTVCVAILAAVSVLVYFLHFKLTKERINPPAKQKSEYKVTKTIAALLKNPSFVFICIASMMLIAFQFYYQSTWTYLFADYYHKPGLYSMVTICTYLPMAIFIIPMNKMIHKIGKKELCCYGMAFAAIVTFILYFIKTSNPYVFLAFTFLSGLGQTFLVLEVWALVMDVIDEHELRTGRREEGTAYAFFSFTRKLGQTLAGVGLNALLAYIAYDGNASKNGLSLPESTLSKLYDISTLVPAIALTIMALALLAYPLGKKKLAEMREKLAAAREENAESPVPAEAEEA